MEQTNEAMSSQAVASVPDNTEKMVPQSKVDEIVRHSNARVAEKARQDAIASFQNQQTASNYSNNDHISEIVSKSVKEHIDQVRREAQEEQMKVIAEQSRQQGEKLATEFFSKVDTAKSNYEDFDDVIKDFPFGYFPLAVKESLNFDNVGDMMYSLANNPSKFKDLEELAKIDPSLARKQMKKFSDSIKANQSASSSKVANKPLSHIKSSPTGIDNGRPTISDLRKKYR